MPRGKSKDKKKKRNYRVEFSRASLFFWGLGSLLFLGWIFVLGILVGRGFLPEGVKALTKLRIPITKIQDVVSSRRESKIERISGMDKDPEFKFYDELSSKKAEVTKKRQHNHKKPPKKSTAASNPETPATDIIAKRVESIGQSIVDQSGVETRQSAGALTARDGWTYTVQVASVESRIQAVKMVDRLKSQGYPAYFYEAAIKGRTYYRVRCGRFGNKNEAEALNRLLAEQKEIRGYVTKERDEISRPGERQGGDKPKTASNQGPSKTTTYTVQIASLNNKDEALKMSGRLKQRGYSVYLHQVNVESKTYYRVRCGRFSSKAAARKHQRILALKESIEGFVTRVEN
jgi:cell division septation protein DedD